MVPGAVLQGASAAQNEAVILNLSGRLNLPALREAFQAVGRRHEALRARMLFDEDAQHITDDGAPTLAIVDVAAADAGRWIAEEIRRPFDLERPLARASVLRLSDEEHLLVLTAHGLIADRRSLHLAVTEMGALYSRLARDPREPRAGHAAARLHRGPGAARAGAGAPARRDLLERALQRRHPADRSPVHAPAPRDQDLRGRAPGAPLEPALHRGLEAWSAQHGSTLFMTLLGAFNVFVHRLTGADDIVVGIFGRGAPLLTGGERLIANATNALPSARRSTPA